MNGLCAPSSNCVLKSTEAIYPIIRLHLSRRMKLNYHIDEKRNSVMVWSERQPFDFEIKKADFDKYFQIINEATDER